MSKRPSHIDPPVILPEPKQLRFLYVPMYSSPHNLGTCSTYNHVKVLIRKMVENRQCYAYVTIPEGTSDQCPELTEHPRIEVIEVKASKNQYRDLCTYPNELVDFFNELEGEHYVDFVMTDKAVIIPFLKEQIHTFTRNGSAEIPIVWINQFFARESAHSFLMEHFFRAQIWGLAEADLLVWSSEQVRQEAVQMARKYVSPSVLKGIIDKSRKWFSAADISRLDKYLGNEKRKDKIVLNYAYATNDTYNYKDVFEILNRVYEGGRDVDILVTTSSKGSIIPQRFKESNVTIHQALPQDEFFEKITKEAHVFAFLPDFSELSQSVMEQQYLGLVGVFPDRKWAHASLYKGYPYIAKNKLELETMLRYLVDNYWSDEVQEVIQKQKDFILDQFDAEHLAVNIYDHASQLVKPAEKLWSTLDSFRSIFSDYEELDYSTWKSLIKEQTTMKMDVENMGFGRYGLSKNLLRKLTMDCGFIDTCEDTQPYFVRMTDV